MKFTKAKQNGWKRVLNSDMVEEALRSYRAGVEGVEAIVVVEVIIEVGVETHGEADTEI